MSRWVLFWWALDRASPQVGFWKAVGHAWRYARQKAKVNRMTRQLEREFDRSIGA